MSDTNFRPGDSLWSLTKKLLDRQNQGIPLDLTGVVIENNVADGQDVTQGSKADFAATDSTSPWTVISILKGIWAKLNGGVAVTGTLTGITNPVTVAQATAANLKVDLLNSGALATVTAVTGITNPVTVAQATASNLKVDLSGSGALPTVTAVTGITNPVTVAQATAANLKVDLLNSGALANVTTVGTVSAITSGNVGGFTAVIQSHPTISTSAYVAGYTVGGILTLTNAFRVSGGTGILESVHVIDRSNQKAPFDILFFQVTPAAATTTDHAAFVFSTDDLNLIGHVSVAAADYVTINSKAVAHETSLGIALKNTTPSASLFAVVVTSGTPTYAAATDLQFTFGILQD